MSKASILFCKTAAKNDNLRDAGLITPPGIQRFDDIVYGADSKNQVLDVYRPKSAKGKKLPVIVSVHGGGWVYGDKERYQYYCMDLAERGFAVVNFTYRLAPDFKFPSSLEDTNTVFTWVLDHAEEYGFDTSNLFAVGDSAGAHLLGLFTGICTNPAYAANFKFKAPKGFVPKAIGLNCGAYHIVMPEDSKDLETDQTAQLMSDLLPGKGTPEELALINVAAQVTPDFPPVFLMTCTNDFLKDEAPYMAAKLIASNVPFELHYYGDSENLLGHVFHCDMKSDDARICNDEECDFFKKLICE